MARMKRIKMPGCKVAAYHVVTRVNARQYRLEDGLQEKFVKHLKKLKMLYFVEYGAYCVLSSHYHLILRFADPQDIRPEEAMKRWNTYHEGTVFKKDATNPEHQAYVVKELTDLSSFMKRLNHHVSVRHNKARDLQGTLWEGRFHSTIMERGYSLAMCAAYIELNAFRASMVRKPEDYAFCSLNYLQKGNKDGLIDQSLIAEGVGADKNDLQGLLQTYTALVYASGARPHKGKANGLVITEAMQKELKAKGIEIKAGSLGEKVREYILGKVVGRSEYVRKFYDEWLNPGYRGARRKRHAAKWLKDLGQGLWTACSREALGLKPETSNDTG
ncbi:MAG: transposase [Planctomycetota bacterium]